MGIIYLAHTASHIMTVGRRAKFLKKFFTFESTLVCAIISNDALVSGLLFVNILAPYLANGKIMDFFLVMILGVVAQIIGYLIYLKKTRKIINIIFHTPLIILVNIVLFGMLNLISMRDNTFIIPYNWALVLSFWTSFSIVGVLINACFIITLKRANNNTKNSIGNIFLVTLSAVGIIGLILESNRNIAPLVTFCMIVITIVLTAIFAFGYMSYLIKHKKEFSFFIIKHPFSNIESPTRNPTRNILLLIVSFFTLFGAGIAYSLILNRTTSFELGQVARAIGAIISGYIILIFVKKDKNSSHTALLVYVIFVSIITLLMIYFNILVYSAIAVQTTVYHAVIAFLLLYITENNIPKKSPNHSVLIIGTALLGGYSSVAITSCLIYKLKISFDLVMMLSIFTLVCGIVFIIVQKYQRKQFDASEKTNIAINNISDAIINLDQDGIITYTNSAAQKLLGKTMEELNGREFCDVYHYIRETGCISEDPLTKVRELGTPLIIETDNIVIEGKQKGMVFEESYFPLIDDSDEYLGTIWVLKDITRKKQKEKEIYQKERIESLGKVAGNIAHNYNNVLSEIMGNAELIKDEVSSNESDLIEEMTSNIFKSVERGKKIGYQILTFSKGGAPVKRWVDITKIIQDTANIIFARSDIQFNLIKEKKISTATELMYVDLEQMTQVFQNLFLNSREAIENTGTVDCEIYDSILENKKGIVIEITDSGKGIDADKIQYVFDPYYSTKDNSSGLGLTVSYNIIKNHGGTINISSRLNEGTKVTIFIPAEKQYVEKNQKKETIQEIDGNNANVLILDDEPMILYILERMLKKLNFTVYSAPSGRELVNKYKELKSKGIPVDFLILDIYVPGELNGQETLNEIRLIDPDIMAVATTGYTDDNIISDPEKHGFQTVLPKPYSRMDLNEVIHKIYQLKKMQ